MPTTPIDTYRRLRNELKTYERPDDPLRRAIQLCAVSKFQPVEAIAALYGEGQRVFGESRAQELEAKAPALPNDIAWHFIGHLQTNKVRTVLPFVDTIQSIDSPKLLVEIDRIAAQLDIHLNGLLEVKVAQEATKYGFTEAALYELLNSNTLHNLTHLSIRGFMGMASLTDDTAQTRTEFAALRRIFDHVKNKYFHDAATFDTLSMGMSGDYHLALDAGSNCVRIGSMLFGAGANEQPLMGS